MKVRQIIIDRKNKKIAFNDVVLENIPVDNYRIFADETTKELSIELYVPHVDVIEGSL